jgi:hypothetical protein
MCGDLRCVSLYADLVARGSRRESTLRKQKTLLRRSVRGVTNPSRGVRSNLGGAKVVGRPVPCGHPGVDVCNTISSWECVKRSVCGRISGREAWREGMPRKKTRRGRRGEGHRPRREARRLAAARLGRLGDSLGARLAGESLAPEDADRDDVGTYADGTVASGDIGRDSPPLEPRELLVAIRQRIALPGTYGNVLPQAMTASGEGVMLSASQPVIYQRENDGAITTRTGAEMHRFPAGSLASDLVSQPRTLAGHALLPVAGGTWEATRVDDDEGIVMTLRRGGVRRRGAIRGRRGRGARRG